MSPGLCWFLPPFFHFFGVRRSFCERKPFSCTPPFMAGGANPFASRISARRFQKKKGLFSGVPLTKIICTNFFLRKRDRRALLHLGGGIKVYPPAFPFLILGCKDSPPLKRGLAPPPFPFFGVLTPTGVHLTFLFPLPQIGKLLALVSQLFFQ